MHSKDRIRLKHMLDSAMQAQEFAQGRTRDSLDEGKIPLPRNPGLPLNVGHQQGPFSLSASAARILARR